MKRSLGALAAIAGGYLRGRLTAEQHQQELHRQAIADALSMAGTQSYLESQAQSRALAAAAEQRAQAAHARERAEWEARPPETPAEEFARKQAEQVAQRQAVMDLWAPMQLAEIMRERGTREGLLGLTFPSEHRLGPPSLRATLPVVPGRPAEAVDLTAPMQPGLVGPLGPEAAGPEFGQPAVLAMRGPDLQRIMVEEPDWAAMPYEEQAMRARMAGGEVQTVGGQLGVPFVTLPTSEERETAAREAEREGLEIEELREKLGLAREKRPLLIDELASDTARTKVLTALDQLDLDIKQATKTTDVAAALITAQEVLDKYDAVEIMLASGDPELQRMGLLLKASVGVTVQQFEYTLRQMLYKEAEWTAEQRRRETPQRYISDIGRSKLTATMSQADATRAYAGAISESAAARMAGETAAGATGKPTTLEKRAQSYNISDTNKWLQDAAPAEDLEQLARRCARRDMGPLATEFWSWFCRATGWPTAVSLYGPHRGFKPSGFPVDVPEPPGGVTAGGRRPLPLTSEAEHPLPPGIEGLQD